MDEKKLNFKPNLTMSPFGRKMLIQAGFFAGMQFAGLDKNNIIENRDKDEESRELYEDMMKALGNVFESHGLTREVEF